jgi:tRNA1Val (adenine37-N6)-methyltransferase
MNDLLRSGEKIDDLMRNGYRIIQDPKRFCFGIDAVLLSGFAKVLPGETVLDLGTGTGILPILLEAKTKGEHFTGLEIQEESADMARRSVLLNHLEDKISIVTGDICDASEQFGASSFSVITVNPPYIISSHGLTNGSDAKTIARHEVFCTVEDVCEAAKRALRFGGRLCICQRPDRLADAMCAMRRHGIEPKRLLWMIHSVGKKPSLFLLEGKKGANKGMVVLPPLFLKDEHGNYTPQALEVYGLYQNERTKA